MDFPIPHHSSVQRAPHQRNISWIWKYLIPLSSCTFLFLRTCLRRIKSSFFLLSSLIIRSALAILRCLGIDAIFVLTVFSWELRRWSLWEIALLRERETWSYGWWDRSCLHAWKSLACYTETRHCEDFLYGWIFGKRRCISIFLNSEMMSMNFEFYKISYVTSSPAPLSLPLYTPLKAPLLTQSTSHL